MLNKEEVKMPKEIKVLEDKIRELEQYIDQLGFELAEERERSRRLSEGLRDYKIAYKVLLNHIKQNQ
jgi:hypothetical protein